MKIFRKNDVSMLINILGMSIAFAVFMILMVQVRWDTTYDKNFKGHEQVFRVENNVMDNGLFSIHMCRPLIEQMRSASPNIEAIGTFSSVGNDVYYREGDKESAITIQQAMVDSTMLDVFPFEIVEGSGKDFNAPGTALLNEAFAEMIFGEESPVGKVLERGEEYKFRIVGVFKNNPRNCSMHYGIIEYIGNEHIDDASEWSFTAYLKLKDPKQAKETENALINSSLLYFTSGDDLSVDDDEIDEIKKGIRIQNLHDAYFARDVRANVIAGNKAVTMTLAAIAILLLLIAVINFINFAFAEIPFRIRGINTRKVLGATRFSLIVKQLCRSALLAAIAFALAVGIVQLVSGTTLAANVSDSIRVGDNLTLLGATLAIAIVAAVIAGVAPAFYSTSQPTVMALKSSFGTTVKGKALRNVLVGLQFVLSFIFIIFALYVSVQTRFLIGRDMGFQQENILQVWCGYYAGSVPDAMETKLLQNPDIVDVTFADSPIVADSRMGWGRTEDGEQIFMEVMPVRPNFVKFFGLEIVEGRDYQESDNQSATGCFIPNETFMKMYPQFHVGSYTGGHVDKSEIVGVVKDYSFKSLQHAMGPLTLYNWGKTCWRNFGMMYVKMAPGADFKAVSDAIKEAVCFYDQTRQPDQVEVRHLDEWIERMYDKEQALGKLVSIASLVALLIAIIGIIGLVFFETQYIRKEIALRRVHGATVGLILQMICKKYLILTFVSFIVAAPVAYCLMAAWRNGFAYQASIPVWIFVLAIVLVLIITIVVVILQSLRAATENPVKALKTEC